MTLQRVVPLVPLALLLSLVPGLPGCWRSSESQPVVLAEAPPEIVSAYTTGLVSRKSVVRVRFVSDVATEDAVGKPLADSPLHVEPAIDGQVVWGSRQELELRPSADLQPGTRYSVTVDLPTILPGNPAAANAFSFDFGVVTQDYTNAPVGLEAEGEDGAVQLDRGVLQLADAADDAAVERMLTARHGDDALTVTWTHDPATFAHTYTVHGIRRTEQGSTLTLSFDGAPVGVEHTDMATVPVPGLNQFVVTSIRAQTEGDRYIEVRFSDPIDKKQDLRGLVRVEGRDDIRLERDASVVRIYASGAWNGTEQVQIAGVRNARGYKLLDARTETVSFAPILPQVRFVGDSVILPTSADLTVPIEVVNVRSVEIEATRVYESNVPQFLQVNDLNGANELKRVGTVVWKDHVEIPAAPGQNNRWVRLGLDVSQLVEKYPTGLYRLSVTFDRNDIVWDCPNAPANPTSEEARPEPAWDNSGGDQSFWDMWEGSGAEDGEWGWDWSAREDPCSPSYYATWWDQERMASRNVVVTDLGLLAKQGADGTLTAVVTDLRTAAPVPGATVDLLDYQLQKLGSAATDADGMVKLATSDEHPFALVARSGQQTSWLKLDRGEALSVAHFDVGGAEVSDGLKGYLYGERGVWRPGDPMYLTFVLDDMVGTGAHVPVDHPIDFKLRNPRGQVVDTRTLTSSVDGFYRIDTHTAPDAPTGVYSAVVRVGGAVFQKSLRVETVMPNRLRIDLPVPKTGVRAPDLTLDTTLASRWLHGAIARSLHADINVDYKAQPTTFAKYADFTFDAPTASVHSDTTELWSGDLDEEGKANVEATLSPPEGAPGMLTAVLRTRVFEPSGAASVDEASVTVSPYERYVGIALPKGDKARGMLLTDTKHHVRVVAVDADGKPAGGGDVELSIRKLRWRWWWEKGEDLTEYAGAESSEVIASGVATLKNGEGGWDFQVNYPEWGRYLVTAHDTVSGHTTGKIVYIDWPGWAGRAQKDQPGGASVLTLTADKEKVEVGQPFTLSFPLPQGARALVSLESGSRVVATQWVLPTPGADTAQVTLTATPEMAPTIYANVTVIQPHQSAANDAPLRLYGVLGLSVFDPATKLQPEITTAATFAPESNALVSVREATGKAMTYTLAVVDEGLLGLTRFQTPNPWDTFYAREALGVRTWDLFDLVTGAYGGTLEGLLAVGGDGEAELNKRPKAQRFKPVVWVGGPYTLEAGKTDQREVPIPQYVGEVRVMVVAGKRGGTAGTGAYGSAEKSVPVKAPLMALATLPRVLGPGEEVELPVSLFALEPSVKDVTVSVATSGPVEVEREKQKTVRFAQPGESMATFRLKVGNTLGVATVTVTATGGGQKATQAIEVDVRHPGAPSTQVVAANVGAGKSWSQEVAFTGMPGTNLVSLEVSRMPPLNLGTRLSDLIQYPHGCIEQTTSAAFPQLALMKLVELGPSEAAAADRNVKAALQRLRIFQAGNGGFGYWPGEAPDEWGSSYAGHFLVEAERAGYPLPPGMRSAWVGYQRDRANRWVRTGPNADLEQAYRLYTLALAGNADMGAMNRLKESTLGAAARWRLASAYLLAGQKSTAQDVIAKADTTVPAYRELSGTFGSNLRDDALILDSLVLMGDLTRAVPLARDISKALETAPFLSTQETAMALVAMARFGNAAPGEASDKTVFAWSYGGGAPVDVASDKAVVQVSIPVGSAQKGRITFENKGAGTLFGRVVVRGLPPIPDASAPAAAPVSEGLALDVRYVNVGGAEVGAGSVEQGTDLVARVTVRNQSGRKLEELALTQILPSGWEIAGLSPGKGEGFQYRDVRDDRVYTYLDLDAGKEVTFDVPVNASYLGHFYLPAVSVEAMYDPTIHASVPGMWTDVTSQLMD